MTTAQAPDSPSEETPDTPPSRADKLRAIAALIKSGGLKPLARYALTQLATNARNTLYRYLAVVLPRIMAALDRVLLPAAQVPDPQGPLRDQLVELVDRQATIIRTAPLHRTVWTWIATRALADAADGTTMGGLRLYLMERYRGPFRELLGHPDARAILGACDVDIAITDLVGPATFGTFTGLGRASRADCVRIVDRFLDSHTPTSATSTPPES